MTTTHLTKKERTLRIISLAITVAIMVLIYVQSAMPDYLSTEESNIIVVLITNIIEKTGRTVSNEELLQFIVRKTAHFTEYAAFGASLFATAGTFLGRKLLAGGRSDLSGENIGRSGNPSVDTKKDTALTRCLRILFFIAWPAGVLYAVTDEIHQLFVPGRYGQWTDVAIDAAGVALGALICLLVLGKHTARKHANLSDGE